MRRRRSAAALFFHCPLGGRQGLETLVRDRPATLDREAICACGETLLGALEGGEPVAKLFGQTFVEFVQVEVCSQVPRLEPPGVLAGVLMAAAAESLLDLLPFRCKQRPGAFVFH